MGNGVEWALLIESRGKPVYNPQGSFDDALDALSDWRKDAPDLKVSIVSRTVVYGDWVESVESVGG